MEKVLVSACLLGRKVRYDGNAQSLSDRIIQQWCHSKRIISVCPEVDAGMGIPRPPAEILGGDGHSVWNGSAHVFENTGEDVSHYFKNGAKMALDLCLKHGVKVAVLTENSPSCGSSAIYDGGFTGNKIMGLGVTAALLKQNNIQVFSQYQIVLAQSTLSTIESGKKSRGK